MNEFELKLAELAYPEYFAACRKIILQPNIAEGDWEVMWNLREEHPGLKQYNLLNSDFRDYVAGE